MLENLKTINLEYETTKEFLADLKKKFRKREKKTIKMTELKRLEQGSKIIEEFIQELRKVARKSKYEKRLLIKKLKREMNRTI